MTHIAAPGDGDCLLGLRASLASPAAATMLSMAFLMGGLAGFALGRLGGGAGNARRGDDRRSIGRSARKDPGWSLDDDGGGDDDEVGDIDGPSTVLSGSIDLMLSRWRENRGWRQRGEQGAVRRGKVVEYLSPEDMARLLFPVGGDPSETLRLGETRVGKSGGPAVPLPRADTEDDHDGDKDRGEAPNTTSLRTGAPPPEDGGPAPAPTTMSLPSFLRLLSLVQRYSVDTSHPFFFNQLFGAADPVALAAEVVALGLNTSAYTYETAPVFTMLEREVLDNVGRLAFGVDEFEGEGLMVPGGSLANLMAMHAARHRWRVKNGYAKRGGAMRPCEVGEHHVWPEDGEDGREEKKLEDDSFYDGQQSSSWRHQQQLESPTSRDDEPDLVAFVSSEAHYSFAKSARVMGIREEDLVAVPTLPDGRMDVDELAKRIQELEKPNVEIEPEGGTSHSRRRRRRTRAPFFVACTAGSTVRGSFDDVADVVRVCRGPERTGGRGGGGGLARSIWVHVDGAWGGSAIFSSRPSVRSASRVDQIGDADSFAFNPHKMLGAPQQTTAFVVRRRGALREANATGAGYLFDPRKAGADLDLGDLGHTCGRRADAIKLWALWKWHGRAGLGRRVDGLADGTRMFAEEIRKRAGRFALACRPWLFNVCFFYFPPRIREKMEAGGMRTTVPTPAMSAMSGEETDGDEGILIPDELSGELGSVSVKLKRRLHEAGEMLIPYQPLSNQKADCFRLVLAGRKDFGIKDVHWVLDTMEKYGEDL